MRLLEHGDARYARAVLLCIPRSRGATEQLAAELREQVTRVELRELDVDDPSDYAQLFAALGPALSFSSRFRSAIAADGIIRP